MAEVKQNYFCKTIFVVVPELQTMVLSSPILLLLLRRLLCDRATRDTDKPDIQPVSEPVNWTSLEKMVVGLPVELCSC